MHKLSIAFLVPGLPFDGNSLSKKSLGGSESAGLYMAQALAKVGHRVKMFCNCEPGDFDGVSYYSADDWAPFAASAPVDVVIVQRVPSALRVRTSAKLNFLWMHDLALGRQADEVRATLWNCDEVFVLSEFHKNQYKEVYGLPDRVLWQTRNGIDLSAFPTNDNSVRNRKRLIYSARPERGLDNALNIFGRLAEIDPEYELHIFGYDNPVEHLEPFYKALRELSTRWGNRIQWRGHLTKAELYAEYAKAGAYLYPTPSTIEPTFAEISCISAMECQAAGLPIITSNVGALPETVGEAGTLISGKPWEPEVMDRYIGAIQNYALDDFLFETVQNTGFEQAKKLGWYREAVRWTEHFEEMMRERSKDKTRLAYHFYRRSDITAAIKALEQADGPMAKRLHSRIAKEYSFTRSATSMKLHYQNGGLTTDRRLSQAPLESYHFDTTEESRFHTIERIIGERPQIKRVLEFGCGHGWSGIYLNKKLRRSWLGVDLDPLAVKWARLFAEKEGMTETMEFRVGDHTIDLSKEEKFDCLIVSEVLEHCIDPVEVMRTLEPWVKEDGIVIITVPYGPSEFGTANWDTFRNHIWELEPSDLLDIFGAKVDLAIGSTPIYPNATSGEMVGYTMVCYTNKPAPLGQIDWDRKLSMQSPRQTLGATMIAGPGCEDTLLWCLNSFRKVVDDLVIIDTGMSQMARSMADSHGARLVPGTPPLEGGFETPRNEGLDELETDWVLWIDTDEKLIGTIDLGKYLRPSLWNGLSIRQHHFTTDASFTPDMPVRCFRRISADGIKMRFWGMIHEHPELEMNKGPGEVIIVPDVHIAHVGYLSESIRRSRFSRNYPMMLKDQAKYPDRLLQKHFMMRDNMLLVMYELNSNGGVMTQNIKAKCEETIELYRKYFSCKDSYSNIDSLQYYSEAMRVLSRGIDVSWAIGVNRMGVGDNGSVNQHNARFEDTEEAEREIAFRLSQKMGRFKGVWF